MTPPHRLELFQKFIRFGIAALPLFAKSFENYEPTQLVFVIVFFVGQVKFPYHQTYEGLLKPLCAYVFLQALSSLLCHERNDEFHNSDIIVMLYNVLVQSAERLLEKFFIVVVK